jgi:hypothetical protein
MSACSRCGASFQCGMADAAPSADGAAREEACWCTRMPILPPEAYAGSASCLCPACLAAKIAEVGQAAGRATE